MPQFETHNSETHNSETHNSETHNSEKHESKTHSEKPIRKQVGRPREEEKSPAQQLWDLRQRMLDLGIDFGNDNERIRKVVGGPRDK